MTLADVRAAAETIQGAVRRTPTSPSETLSAITGANVWLKFENLQFTGAFKERGARNFLALLLPPDRARGVVAASAGMGDMVSAAAQRTLVPCIHQIED